MEKDIQSIKRHLQKIYEDVIFNKITEDDYIQEKTIYTEKENEIAEKIHNTKKFIKQYDDKKVVANEYKKIIDILHENADNNLELINNLIKRVDVESDGSLNILWNFNLNI